MFVCVCNGVTEEQIRIAVCAGASTLPELGACLGVAVGCGCCRTFAEQVLDETLQVGPRPENRAAV